MNYVLYGQPASGKTTLGKLLAKHLDTPFIIDGDEFREMFTNKNYGREGREENIRNANAVATYLNKKGKDGKIGTIKIDTAEQELISTAIFKAVLEKRTPNWDSFEKMYNDPKSGLKKIHPGLNKVNRYDETDWWLHFDRQYKEIITSAATKSGLKVGHYEVYNRDGTGMKPGEDFMQFISDLITKGTGGSLDEASVKMFAKKDSWNPADIWLLDTTGGAYEKVKKELELATTVSKVNDDSKVAYLELMALKKKMLQEDIRSAALSGQSAKDAMKSVVRAETMEAVVGYISSVLKTVPFPANLVLAAGGGALVGGLIDKGLSSFATGGDFVTSGPQMIMVGDNPGGRERVQVSPLSSPNINGPGGGGVTVNIQGGIVDESYVSNELIPAINKATSLGTKLNA